MQRSRKALLRRRAAVQEKGVAGRQWLYRLSASLAILLWGLILILNALISHGNGYRDVLGAVVGESIWHENLPDRNKGSDYGDALSQSFATPDSDDKHSAISVGETPVHNTKVLASEDDDLNLSTAGKEEVTEQVSDIGIKAERETSVKSDRLSRVSPPGLDEFKSKAITAKEKHLSSQTGAVIHRVEPDGKEYNYASATKGAKVLAFNKEAKGATNILDKDKDKYLRNPCSAEEKYIIIELSEETLVDTIEIANFEHYSSNLKDFELLSSSTYPTDNWIKIGNFTAGNVKHAQRFTLPEPKWSRYLKLKLLSHHGSEFYCTLSVVEVYGVDVVERMLEDLISVENKRSEPEEQNGIQMPLHESTEGDDLYQDPFAKINNDSPHENLKTKREVPKYTAPDSVVDTRSPQVGRMPGDTVLKILMQKVQSLDVNFSVLERYLEELNSRYGSIFKEFDDDIADKELLLEKIRLALKNLENSKDIFASDIRELLSWKILASLQMDQLVKDNAILRSEVDSIRNCQVDMENRGLAVIFMSFVFACFAIFKLFIEMFLSTCRIYKSKKFCRMSSGWLVLLISSSIITFILVI